MKEFSENNITFFLQFIEKQTNEIMQMYNEVFQNEVNTLFSKGQRRKKMINRYKINKKKMNFSELVIFCIHSFELFMFKYLIIVDKYDLANVQNQVDKDVLKKNDF